MAVAEVLGLLKKHMCLADVHAGQGDLFPDLPQDFCDKHLELLKELLGLDQRIKKTVLVEALVQLDKWTKGKLHKGDLQVWARAQAYKVKMACMHVLRTKRNIVDGSRLPDSLQQLVEVVRSASSSLEESPPRKKACRLAGRMVRGTRRLLRRRSSEPTPLQPPLPILSPQPDNNKPPALRDSLPTTAAEVYKLYGHSQMPNQEVILVESTSDLESSSDDQAVCVGASSSSSHGVGASSSSHKQPDTTSLQPTTPNLQPGATLQPAAPTVQQTTEGKEYWDGALQCVVRALRSGELIKATTRLGPNGFLEGVFPDGKVFSTTVPNLLAPPENWTEAPPQSKKAKKKPTAKPKAKAKGKAEPKTKTKTKPQPTASTDQPASRKLRRVDAKDKSYIVEFKQPENKWFHLVTVWAKSTPRYMEICDKVAEAASKNMSKEALVELRDHLVQQQLEASTSEA